MKRWVRLYVPAGRKSRGIFDEFGYRTETEEK